MSDSLPISAARPRPVVLCILDGWGQRAEADHNAITAAETPVWDRMLEDCPRAALETSGLEVGLPPGQMGNSEVGHTNLGAGRVVLQDLPRIDDAVDSGELAGNSALKEMTEALVSGGGTCHLMGLVSPGGVHSHQGHMAALARAVSERGVPVAIHAFLDGRDTPPESALGFVSDFLEAIGDLPSTVRLATLAGRYWAMDRDRRWERVEKAYRALVQGEGGTATDALRAIEDSYGTGTTDEFVTPTVIAGYQGMADGDGLLMANFRADRVRQLLSALIDPEFDGFARSRPIDFAAACGMSEYGAELNKYMSTLFATVPVDKGLGEVISGAGMRQLRIAETEKYAHVTFFFNGGRELVFDGEDRVLVPSPKVATYDLQPEMSAPEVTDKLVEAVDSGEYDFIVVNYANPDMVGHTGIMEAAIKAVACIDACLGRLSQAVERAGGALLITADHGNVEMMRDQDQPHTAHTTCLVPLVLAAGPTENVQLNSGRLADVGPTLLTLLGLPQPPEMTGTSLIAPSPTASSAAGR